MLDFILNEQSIRSDLPTGMVLLDFIRYHLHLMGTKVGCREGDCGACTVLVGEWNGHSVRYKSVCSCLTPLANVRGKHVVTVEGLNPPQNALTAVQQAFVETNGTQCGFCTVGFVLSLTGFGLDANAAGAEQAITAIDGNICRCTGYKSIERAAALVAAMKQGKNGLPPLEFAIAKNFVPPYFREIPARLATIAEEPRSEQPPEPAEPVGGGTDLYVQRHEAMVSAPALHLANRPELRIIRQMGTSVEIGGAATVTDLLESPIMHALFPRLENHLKRISSTPIRNMATVAGNIANASPIGDLTVWFLALNADLIIGSNPKREIPLREFFLGYKTLAKKPGELIESIRFQAPRAGFLFNFEKVSKRTYLDIASVNTALGLQMEGERISRAHVSIGGVAPVPLYLKHTSAFLEGHAISADFIEKGQQILQSEISPISDVRGSKEYKRLLANQLFKAHFIELFPTL